MDRERSESNGEMLVVDYKGTVAWVPPIIYRSNCTVDMSDFPFDIQVSACIGRMFSMCLHISN